MRRLLSFACAGQALGATLDAAEGATGILMVTGGSQTRIGSHRMYERLTKALVDKNYPCFRFDRRGVGDSAGEDPGWRGSGPDIAGAAAAFRSECPRLERIVGFGLCDGATALMLHGAGAGLDALLLVNPWLVEAGPGEPPPAAIRSHYRARLSSLPGWKKLLSGSVAWGKLFRGILKAAAPAPRSELAAEAAAALARARLPAQPVLASGDATAIAAARALAAPGFDGLVLDPIRIDTDSHTFARPGDGEELLAAATEALRRLGARAIGAVEP